MTDQLPSITEVQRLRLEPGDALVITVASATVSMASAQAIKEQVRAALNLPDNSPVLVVGPGVSVGVVSPP